MEPTKINEVTWPPRDTEVLDQFYQCDAGDPITAVSKALEAVLHARHIADHPITHWSHQAGLGANCYRITLDDDTVLDVGVLFITARIALLQIDHTAPALALALKGACDQALRHTAGSARLPMPQIPSA